MSTHDPSLCLQCGYDLRGLSPDGVCPECEFPIERTLAFPQLREDRVYLARVRRGAAVLVAALALLVVGFLGVTLYEALHWNGTPRVSAVVMYAGFVLCPIGWIFITCRPP